MTNECLALIKKQKTNVNEEAAPLLLGPHLDLKVEESTCHFKSLQNTNLYWTLPLLHNFKCHLLKDTFNNPAESTQGFIQRSWHPKTKQKISVFAFCPFAAN